MSLIRRNVLEGSINVRDALIDADDDARETYREQLRVLREEAERRVAEYVPQAQSAAERDEWAKLQAKLAEFWTSLEFVFADDLPTNTTRAATMLRRNVRPIRKDVLTLLDNLKALQGGAAAAQCRRRSSLRRRAGAVCLDCRRRAAARSRCRVVRDVARRGTRDRDQPPALAETDNRLDLERLSARLVEAQEQERRSLARELHDEVGQALTAIKMAVGVALRTPGTHPRAHAALEEARAVAETTLQGVRDLSQLCTRRCSTTSACRKRWRRTGTFQSAPVSARTSRTGTATTACRRTSRFVSTGSCRRH